MTISKEIQSLFRFEWDPIGLGDGDQVLDEYDSYARQASSMLNGGSSVEEVAQYLGQAQTKSMGMPLQERCNREVAQKLKDLLS